MKQKNYLSMGQLINLDDVEALISRPLDNEAFHLVNALDG
jgi:hypothetical protein